MKIAYQAVIALLVLHGTASAAPGDDWHPTRIFGQIDTRQTNYNQVVPNRLFQPAGVVVDRMPAPLPSRLYIWDSGNNRILGFAHAGTCVGSPRRPQARPAQKTRCVELAAAVRPTSSARIGGDRTALGLRRGRLQRRQPKVMPARADSLCAIPYPFQISPLEGPRANQMATDAAHNLYVMDLLQQSGAAFQRSFRYRSICGCDLGTRRLHESAVQPWTDCSECKYFVYRPDARNILPLHPARWT